MFDNIKDYIPSIHKEGYIFIILFLLGTVILFAISNTLGYCGLILTLWCVFFFRDPERITFEDADIVVSPADGVVQKITQSIPPKELDMVDHMMTRVSIFLNVFDVHVNRVPIAGRVKELHYNPGKFFNASLDKASEYNERQSILIETKDGNEVAVVQIAGLVARRIVCDLKKDDAVDTGQRFGIIRFGSRVDIYLPIDVQPQVLEKQRMTGGETIIADFKNRLAKSRK